MKASLVLGLALSLAPSAQEGERETTVGVPARIEELVLPGSELEAAPAQAESPIVLRILATSPHGTAFRYDIEFYGLDPGEYDLSQWLRRIDGSQRGEFPAIPVSIRSVLPAGQVLPHAPERADVPAFGGYRSLVIGGGVAWTLGLAAILFAGRMRRRDGEAERARPRTLAERLRPLVERARRGELSRTERAELELSLVAWWRRRLELDQRRPEEALAQLHAHPESGPLLRSLEEWLHRPDPASQVDVSALLEPYRDLPADALAFALDRKPGAHGAT